VSTSLPSSPFSSVVCNESSKQHKNKEAYCQRLAVDADALLVRHTLGLLLANRE
jgi:hypothetical protein